MIDKLKYNIFLFEIEIIFSSTVFCGLGGKYDWGGRIYEDKIMTQGESSQKLDIVKNKLSAQLKYFE